MSKKRGAAQMSLLEERFRMMKEEACHNWAFWDQRLFYVSDVEEILSINHLESLLFLEEPQNPVLVKALKWALFYPLCQEVVKPEDLCRFFVSLGWFEEA
jgi:hypothetical protein